jgi:hypothetical protein
MEPDRLLAELRWESYSFCHVDPFLGTPLCPNSGCQRKRVNSILPEIAETAGDNMENASYVASALLDVVSYHLSIGHTIGLQHIGTLKPTARGVEFSASRSLLRKIRCQDTGSRK